MSDTAAQPNPGPVSPEHSDNAVAARFNTAMLALPKEQRGNIIVKENTVEPDQSGTNPTGGEGEKKKDTPVDDLPTDFLGEEKPTVDEYDRITSEEQKGHITSEHWKNYKKLSKSKVDALTKELEEVRGKLPKDDFVPEKVSKEMESMRGKLKEYEDLIARKHVQESPQFKEKFTNREQLVEGQIEELGKHLSLEPDQVHAILNASMKRRMELISEIDSPAAQASLSSLLLERDRIGKEKAAFLQDHEKNTQSWAEQERVQSDAQKAKQKELYDYAFNEVSEKLAAEGHTWMKKSASREDWNKQLEQDLKEAKEMYDGVDFTPQRDAEMFIRAKRSITMEKIADNAIKRAVAAEKELAELKAAGPSASQAQNGQGSDPTKNMTNDERAAFTFNEMQSKAKNGALVRR